MGTLTRPLLSPNCSIDVLALLNRIDPPSSSSDMNRLIWKGFFNGLFFTHTVYQAVLVGCGLVLDSFLSLI